MVLDSSNMVSFVLWIGVIVINYLMMLVGFQQRKKAASDISKLYFLGMVLFFLIHGISRLFYLYYDFFNADPLNKITYQIGQMIGILSITALIYAIEKTIFTKSKRFFTVYGIISVICSIIAIIIQNATFSQILLYVTVPVLGLIVPLIYLYVGHQSVGNLKTTSYIILIGILLFELGQMSHTQAAIDLVGQIVEILSPLCMIIGIILVGLGLKKKE